MECASDHPRYRGVACDILTYLHNLQYADRNREPGTPRHMVGAAELAARFNVTPRGVQKALARLSADGLITDTGGGRPRYRLTDPASDATDPTWWHVALNAIYAVHVHNGWTSDAAVWRQLIADTDTTIASATALARRSRADVRQRVVTMVTRYYDIQTDLDAVAALLSEDPDADPTGVGFRVRTPDPWWHADPDDDADAAALERLSATLARFRRRPDPNPDPARFGVPAGADADADPLELASRVRTPNPDAANQWATDVASALDAARRVGADSTIAPLPAPPIAEPAQALARATMGPARPVAFHASDLSRAVRIHRNADGLYACITVDGVRREVVTRGHVDADSAANEATSKGFIVVWGKIL